jgi:hypothetical protein
MRGPSDRASPCSPRRVGSRSRVRIPSSRNQEQRTPPSASARHPRPRTSPTGSRPLGHRRRHRFPSPATGASTRMRPRVWTLLPASNPTTRASPDSSRPHGRRPVLPSPPSSTGAGSISQCFPGFSGRPLHPRTGAGRGRYRQTSVCAASADARHTHWFQRMLDTLRECSFVPRPATFTLNGPLRDSLPPPRLSEPYPHPVARSDASPSLRVMSERQSGLRLPRGHHFRLVISCCKN